MSLCSSSAQYAKACSAQRKNQKTDLIHKESSEIKVKTALMSRYSAQAAEKCSRAESFILQQNASSRLPD
eukprot:4420-Heterococcus_DN1.PRE.2